MPKSVKEPSYRSTRQLIGRLECFKDRGFAIHYDLLDGASLEFKEGRRSDSPYIPVPFPPHPPATKWETSGPEKRLRPYLFWAAMHLASKNAKQQRAILISITQHPGGYAQDFLTLLDKTWAKIEKPVFFEPPTDQKKLEIWEKCLRSCEDYFGKESHEYRLLQRGIVVHHGKMPGLMARLLIEVIQERIVHLVLATSTLSEGVNLPFETILIPSLTRFSKELDVHEFGNLVGRAGRPGFGTEGQSLVLLQAEPALEWSAKKARNRYFTLINVLKRIGNLNSNQGSKSPLAELLFYIEEQWRRLSRSTNRKSFMEWLENTAPLSVEDNINEDIGLAAIEALDSLDGFLVSAIVEVEQIARAELSSEELEEKLRQIWQRSYARYVSQEEKKLEDLFIRRGRTLKVQIYPDSSYRRRLYRTSLPPRSASRVLNLYPAIRKHLETGKQYALWNNNERFEYIRAVMEQLRALPKFRGKETVGKKVAWHEVLRWWLDRNSTKDTPTNISEWHEYVSQNFGYRFNWGLGSIIALAIDEAYGGMLIEPSLENWPQTGLPWIVLWIKELIIWGTLEPVAAYLLARGMEITRDNAEKTAQFYYNDQSKNQTPDEILNATIIRDWAKVRLNYNTSAIASKPPNQIKVTLLRDFSNSSIQHWKVVPTEVVNDIYWLDPAGFPLAICRKPEKWNPEYLDNYDFILDVSKQAIFSNSYI